MPQYNINQGQFNPGRTQGRIWIPIAAGAVTAGLITYLLDQGMRYFGMPLYSNELPFVTARSLIDIASVYPVFNYARNLAEESQRLREIRLYQNDLARRHGARLDTLDDVDTRAEVNRAGGLRGNRGPNRRVPRITPRNRGQLGI